MDLIQDINEISPAYTGGVLTLGNFDGVHIGHQAMIRRTVERAKSLNVPSIVIVFEPQPAEFFSGEPPARLTTFNEKCQAMAPLGVDAVLCLTFDNTMAELSAEDFVKTILVDKLKARHVLVGDDFRFGHARTGDHALLSRLGEAFGFTTEAMHSIMGDGFRVSSTQVRVALKAGDFETAARLLGRPYHIEGRVVHGDERGRLLGYPTANIEPSRLVLPLRGVFAVRVQVLGQAYEGMANVGTRPTVDGLKTLIEVNLFDFNETIYDQDITVIFCAKMRDEQRFSSIDELKAQLNLDKTQVKAYFTHG